ncbi:hypothetical protein SELMODRAFT_442798 [Selaginella moellendorffii]|uniref:Homing endonuclease LAGLIDADG domain-containing protein n=1 Tax=Selaginella moellendorffii TaxID=88036 RepID=D8RW96_SELML|nr:pentatricopeptide repeat-containing protein OTP51, chloroplastic [Selaginella moellendorffii]EFJ23510.1 hypothetical protein SELMODRAFT_442798 [Selaginella moellendorffii]|eukprot:XP_002975309.1 pentatricopeptide repeat-containing protein OTP51, chloroplastic [Selaginella moellendorffii]
MSCNGLVAMPSMTSILAKRAGCYTSIRGKCLLATAAAEFPARSSSDVSVPGQGFRNRPQRVPWGSDFWERGNGGDRGREFSDRDAGGAVEEGGVPFKDPKRTPRKPRKRLQQLPPYGNPRESDIRFSRRENEIGRATKILSSLNEAPPKSAVIERSSDSTAERDEGGFPDEAPACAVKQIPAYPTTIYGHPIEHWRVKVLEKKKARAAELAKLDADLDESVYLNEEWKRKRIHWLCTEIPRLDSMQTVKILNSQVKWLHNKDISIVCHRLLSIDHFIRAHRVFKWSQQRPWFVLDFQLASRMSELLGQTGKVGRARDLFDIIIQYAYVPKESTYSTLIKSYLQDGRYKYVDEAWKLYNRMREFGGYEPPAIVKHSLFKFLTESGKASLRWADRANAVFNSIRECNLPCTTEMYETLVIIHAVKGDEARVQFLVDDMKSQGLELSPLIFGALIRVCSKSGNYVKAEKLFEQLKETQEELDWHYYIALMEAYGKAGLPGKAMDLFRETENSPTFPKFALFKIIIEVMASNDQVEATEELLGKLHPSLYKFQTLQSAFNAVMEMYSRLGKFDKVDSTYAYMSKHGCRPNRESYHLQLQAFIDSGRLDKAEELYNNMIERKCLRPDFKTHGIMLGAYGKADRKDKVKEIFKLLTEHRQPVPEEFQPYVEASVKTTWVEKAKLYVRPKLTSTQRAILAGVLLAGTRMTAASYNGACIHFEQDAESYKGQALIHNLYEIFTDWAVETPKVVEDSGGQGRKLHFQTTPNVKFYFYYHQYRPNGEQKIPRLVHRWIPELTLAYWYMYGGHRSLDGRSMVFNAEAYDHKELCLVVEAMYERRIQCRIMRDERGKHYLEISSESAVWLWKLVAEYVLPELIPLLKIEPTSEQVLELPEPTHPFSGEETDSEKEDDLSEDQNFLP